jgi:MFS family permease
MDCFRPSDNRILFRTLTGISIQAWQQLTGINFIFYFGTTFFTNAGIHDPFLISIAISTVNVVMTLPGIWGVERFGRRRLLLVGAVGMTVCEFIIAIIGSTTPASNQSAQSTLVAFVCFYIAFFASTWGPITWVVTGEIFPLQIRAKAMSLSVASNWLFNWAIAYTSEYFPYSGACSRDSYLFGSAVHGRLWPRKRKLGYQGVLHLGLDVLLLYHLCILLHSRDQGTLS